MHYQVTGYVETKDAARQVIEHSAKVQWSRWGEIRDVTSHLRRSGKDKPRLTSSWVVQVKVYDQVTNGMNRAILDLSREYEENGYRWTDFLENNLSIFVHFICIHLESILNLFYSTSFYMKIDFWSKNDESKSRFFFKFLFGKSNSN